MIKNYIFDLYGTLVDIHTEEGKLSVWRKIAFYFCLNGAEYEARELKTRYIALIREEEIKLHRRLRKLYPEITVKEAEIDLGRVIDRLYKEKGVRAGKHRIAETMHAMRAITLEKLRLFAGAKELLTALKENGCNIYLLSNAQAEFTRPEMDALGLTGSFDDIFFSSDLQVKKPSKYFYDALFQEHGLKKEESVMVGNDRFADVQGALDYGIRAIYLHTEQSTPFEGPLPEGSVQVDRLLDILEG